MVALKYLYFMLAILQALNESYSYKPVIIIHGILEGASGLEELKSYIDKAHPGTEVHAIDMFDYYNSFEPMWNQVEAIRNVTHSIMKSAKNGVHIIGYSQGGLIARGLIQTTDDHNVDNFIALSSPLNGQYGDTYVFNWLFPHIIKEEMYKLFYTKYGQSWSIGNYWKDPHEITRYEEYSDFLAQLNKEVKAENSKFKTSWKNNFTRLKKLVLIGGPDDEVITPWQSAQFGFYNGHELVEPMKNLKVYRDDSFGLLTLDKSESIQTCTFPGVRHLRWPKTPTVFEKCIEPFLT
uniref:lysosomal thioesterase PPT2-A-like n=1 Tax=Styela clava TaxID=7725 RepID=UPI001939B706|nr:lysosomal thioesterase PPT2-A-like [Styela clava]XP_039251354.1 lysosomal thioesterase PPT2-A-like [Styela clava]